MKIDWKVGNADWAYRHFAGHLISELPDFEHSINGEGGDVIWLEAVDQLAYFPPDGRTILHLQGHRWYDRQDRRTARYLELMSRCGAVAASNMRLAAIAEKINGNVVVVPNCLDLSKWVPSGGRSVSPPVAGFVGNISSPEHIRYRGYDLAKSACEKLGMELLCALYGEKQIPYERMMENFYWNIDVLLHPTSGEGCSNTLTEACACGVPIVTTRTAGFHSELMTHGVNVVFCEKSLDGLCPAIEEALRTKDVLSVGARKFAEDHLDIRKVINLYRNIIEQAGRLA